MKTIVDNDYQSRKKDIKKNKNKKQRDHNTDKSN